MAASVLVGALAAGGLLIGSGTALATPSGCSTSKNINTATGGAKCTGGTGTYRVKVVCVDGFTGDATTVYGPYVGIGRTSSKQCPAPQRDSIRSVGVQFG